MAPRRFWDRRSIAQRTVQPDGVVVRPPGSEALNDLANIAVVPVANRGLKLAIRSGAPLHSAMGRSVDWPATIKANLGSHDHRPR